MTRITNLTQPILTQTSATAARSSSLRGYNAKTITNDGGRACHADARGPQHARERNDRSHQDQRRPLHWRRTSLNCKSSTSNHISHLIDTLSRLFCGQLYRLFLSYLKLKVSPTCASLSKKSWAAAFLHSNNFVPNICYFTTYSSNA